jgi:hypothetical protein
LNNDPALIYVGPADTPPPPPGQPSGDWTAIGYMRPGDDLTVDHDEVVQEWKGSPRHSITRLEYQLTLEPRPMNPELMELFYGHPVDEPPATHAVLVTYEASGEPSPPFPLRYKWWNLRGRWRHHEAIRKYRRDHAAWTAAGKPNRTRAVYMPKVRVEVE